MSTVRRRSGARQQVPSGFDPGKLAQLVTGTRSEFARIFDEHARLAAKRAEPESGRKFRPFMVVAIGCHDDREAFKTAFADAYAGRWQRELVMACVAAAVLPGAPAPAGRAVDLQRATAGSQIVTEAVSNAEAGFLDATVISPGGIAATQRVCKITVKGPGIAETSGSGFLVGPQTVLTAWHVVDACIDRVAGGTEPEAKPKPHSHQHITVAFDDLLRPGGGQAWGLRSTFRVTPDWLVAGSPFHPAERPGGGRPGRWPDPLSALDGFYDFAVIKLDGTPGLERGYYKLDAAYEFVAEDPDGAKKGDYLFVFQHPYALSQRAAVTESTRFFDKTNKWRLGHRANTGAGSSGGICLDKNFSVAGLHQASVGDGWNGAIPVQHIAARAPNLEKVDEGYTTVTRLLDGRPVFGRETFQRGVWQLASGKYRFLVASRPSRRGNSFCHEIMLRLLPSERHLVCKLDASKVPPDAVALAQQLLAVVEREPLGELPSKLSTDPAWIKSDLLPIFSNRLNAAVQDRLFWVVLDELRRPGLARTGASAFLQILYDNIVALPSLRFVFLELSAAPAGANRDLVVNDVVDEEGDAVASYLMRVHHERLAHAGPAQARLLARIAAGLSATAGDGSLAALQRAVQESIDPYLDNS